MRSSETVVARLRELLAAHGPVGRIAVAFSGGLDSLVLLHMLAAARAGLPGALCAVHVDHGLHPDSAAWARRCAQVCASLAIDLHARRLAGRPPAGASLEAWARRERYRAIRTLLAPRDVLLTAHHQRDQAETLLLRVLRGAGPDGLAAMQPAARIHGVDVLRPLLDWPRQELEAYAAAHRLVPIDDPANADLRFDRSFLRSQVMPVLRARWPALDATLARAAGLQAEARALREAALAPELARLAPDRGLPVALLRQRAPAQQRELLRAWIRGGGYPMPGAARLESIRSAALHAAPDRNPCVAWAGVELRRHAGRLHLMAPVPRAPAAVALQWLPPAVLALPWGRLLAEPVTGAGIAQARVPAGGLTVRLRQGGERCRPAGRAHAQSLKHALQEARVPPWERPFVPLLMCGATIAAVAGAFVCAGYQAQAGEAGWAVYWERA